MDNHQINNSDLPAAQPSEHTESTNVQENTSSLSTEISKEEHRHHSGHHHSSHHHSHHHRHHHSGHRHHRHRFKKKKSKWNSKIILIASLAILVFWLAFVVVDEIRGSRTSGGDPTSTTQSASDTLVVELINGEGVLVKDAVSKYLLKDLLSPENATITPHSFGNGARIDEQVPVALKFSVKKGYAISYKIELADNNTFSNAEVSYIEATSGTYQFEHLYANTTYYYRVTVYTSKGFDTQTGYFKTADTPRILSIDGSRNVRDIGNWKTDSGKRIKQGLLLRGTELDGAVESGYHVTNDGLVDLLEIYGIKTDMDLRSPSASSKDALGSRVEHKYYNMVMYAAVFTEQGKERVKEIFCDLANADNYPIYLHCTYGCDRTGIVCYLLEALLGVSRGDCLKEYGLSNMQISNIRVVEEGLKAYEGNTLKEQAESYLLSCGVSAYQIQNIRTIFLGE